MIWHFNLGGVGGQVGANLMEERRSCQDHGELTGVVGVVEPGLMVDIPGMISPGETDNTISGLSPHSEIRKTNRSLCEKKQLETAESQAVVALGESQVVVALACGCLGPTKPQTEAGEPITVQDNETFPNDHSAQCRDPLWVPKKLKYLTPLLGRQTLQIIPLLSSK